MKPLHGALACALFFSGPGQAEPLWDESRARSIPVEIKLPRENVNCTVEQPCPVAFLSAGYGVAHTEYNFVTKQLVTLGYMVVEIGHELPGDPPLSVQGNLYETRSENWQRGARTLDFIQQALQSRHAGYNFDELLLIGHSNGGDISAWLGNEATPYVKTIITLDHRRVPLPRNKDIAVLSVRGSDFPADKGVLPNEQESDAYGSCVVRLTDARHNDMTDAGPATLKNRIAGILAGYLTGKSCGELQST